MTTINGKNIPSQYRSLTDLPDIITEMERYGDCSDRNGNLDRNEALCVVNYVGDEMITVDDYELAQAHSGLSSLIDMTQGQFKDLCSYFGETFKTFPPYVEYQKDDENRIRRKGISRPGENTSSHPENDIFNEITSFFVDDILSPSQDSLFFDTLAPLINQLSIEEQQVLFQQLTRLDTSAPELQLADEITAILQRHSIGISIAALRLEGVEEYIYYRLDDQ